ncbi:MAG: hypothetical protein Q7S00_03075, partial [bacterium]|nr:hypothetical protein [bacterium]
MKHRIFFILFLFLLSPLAHARVYIQVNQPTEKKFPIAIPDLTKLGEERDSNKWAERLPELLRRDMEIAGLFEIMSPEFFPEEADGATADSINFPAWSLMGAQALVKGSVTPNKD